MWEIFTTSSSYSLLLLCLLTFLYFLENFDRYLIAVSPIPYIDYSSYEYSILAGPAFTVIYAVGGLFFALGYYERPPPAQDQSQHSAEEEVTDAKRSRSHSPHEVNALTAPVDKDVQSKKSRKSRQSRLSKEMVLTLATCTFSAAFTFTAFATTFYQQCIIRVVMGFAQSVITPFSTSLIRDHFAPEVSGAAFGIFNVGTYVAFSLSLSFGIYVYLTFGWRAGYLLFGMIGFLAGFFLPCLLCCKKSLKQQPPVQKYQHLDTEEKDESSHDNGLYGVKRVSEREGGRKEVEDFQRYYPSVYNSMMPRANPMLSNTIPIQSGNRPKAHSMSHETNNIAQSFPPSIQSPPMHNSNYIGASSGAVSISDGLDEDDEDFMRVSIHSPLSTKRSIQQHQDEYDDGLLASPFPSFPESSNHFIQDDPYNSMNNMYSMPSTSYNNIAGGGTSSVMGTGIAQSYDSQRSLSTIASNSNNTNLPPASSSAKASFSASHHHMAPNAPTSSIPRTTSSQSLSMKSDFSSQHSSNFIPRSILQPFPSRLLGEHNAPPSNRSSFANSSLSTIDVDDIGDAKDDAYGGKANGDDASSVHTYNKYTEKMEKLSVVGRIGFHLHQIIVESWWKHNPSILLLCLATGIRIGGGYIWSAYTGVYFSDLFSYETDSISCNYSFNVDLTTGLPNDMCSSDYPYCVSGSCAALSDYPWHNEVNTITLYYY